MRGAGRRAPTQDYATSLFMLTKAQHRALLLQMHRSIEEAATQMAAQVVSSNVPSLNYPPNSGFSEAEVNAIGNLKAIPGMESALRKVIANAASQPLYKLACILDGIADPADYKGKWLGARIKPVSPTSDEDEAEQLWRDNIYESYWEWRRIRPDPGWRLDIWAGEQPETELGNVEDDPPRLDPEQLRWDREFYDGLGPEDSLRPCRREGCSRGAIPNSVLCKRHHFEMIKRYDCPFAD